MRLLALAGLTRLRTTEYVLVVVGESPPCPQFTAVTRAAAETGVPRYNIKRGGARPMFWPRTRVVVTGTLAPDELQDICKDLRAQGHMPIVISNFIEESESMHDMLEHLNEKRMMQLVPSSQAILLFKDKPSFIYAFPKVDATASVVVLFGGGERVLVIERDREPYMGMFALPGGFINAMLERLERTGAREMGEEVKVRPGEDQLILIDVRSTPFRDERGHVIDHGYLWIVSAELEERVLAALQAGDDARQVIVKPVAEVLSAGMAFDHDQPLIKALEMVKRACY